MHVTLTDAQALVVREALLDLADRHYADANAYRRGAPGREMAIRRATDALALSKMFRTAGATLAEAA